jgi:hypothetical protein
MSCTRPIYETQANLDSERTVALRLCWAIGCGGVRQGQFSVVDWRLVDGERNHLGWAEIKCRTNPMHQYPTYMISEAKIKAMLKLQQESRSPVILAVQWSDWLGVLRLPCPYRTERGGRTDRGDARDVEDVAHFDISRFEPVAEVIARA